MGKKILAYAIPFEDSVDIYGNEEIYTCTCGDYFYVTVCKLHNKSDTILNVDLLLRSSDRYKDYELGLFKLSKTLKSNGTCKGCGGNSRCRPDVDTYKLLDSAEESEVDELDDQCKSLDSENYEGDSLPYPPKTKYELDNELDELYKSKIQEKMMFNFMINGILRQKNLSMN
jgi:hypothetical protein